MRVLVTGGAGYIGSAAVRLFLDAGHEVVVLDRLNWGTHGLDEVWDRITFIEGDCRSSADVVYALEGIDQVVHLAGIIGDAACRDNYLAHHTINVEATRTLVNLCTDPALGRVDNFIFLSSCSVFGNTSGLVDEVMPDTEPNPISHYADGKLKSEKIIAEAAEANPSFTPTILRLTTAFGWSPRARLDLVTNLFTYRAWRDGAIDVTGGGHQYRSLIHVEDIASAILQTAEAERFRRDRRIFHVGEESNNLTIREIADTVKRVPPETEIRFPSGPDTDGRDYRINCQLIKNIIGWNAQWTVEDGVRDLVKHLESDDHDWAASHFRNDQFPYR